LPGQEDIDGLSRLLAEKRELLLARRRDRPKEPLVASLQGLSTITAADADDFVVRPIFASLPFDQQERVFEASPPGCRKIVLATNIAETSITIPGIRFVVDTGFMKLKICHPQTGVELLRLVETSQASASQRAGRAGREAPGEAYRLYVESAHAQMPPQAPPEILRCDMSTVYLQLKVLGIEQVQDFPLVDRPPQEALVKAAHFLCRIGALTRANELTDVGSRLAMLPIHPLHAYCLLVAIEFECVSEMVTIVAMLSTETPFFITTRSQRELPPAARAVFHDDGDHLTLLSMYGQWKRHPNQREFSRRCSLNHSALEHAAAIRKQLKDLVQQNWGAQLSSCGGQQNWAVVRRCLLKSCFTQTARRDDVQQTSYLTLLTHQTAKLHPSSVLFRKRPQPPCVVYSELVTTTKSYLRIATEVDPAWLPELCPQHFAATAAAAQAVGH
jgi:ATP-dependent RNA helicase DHX8/PRP22